MRPLAKATVGMLGLQIVLLAGLAILAAALLSRLMRATPVPQGWFLTFGLLVVTTFLVMLVTAGVFIAWFHRGYGNVEALGGDRRFGRGWSIGAWFVPILNLFRPKQMADELWIAGNSDGSRRVSPLVHWWWGLFVVAAILDRIAARAGGEMNTVDELGTSVRFSLVSTVASLVAAVLAVRVVLAITRRMDGRASTMANAPPSAGPGGAP
jgi:hypothetical protein